MRRAHRLLLAAGAIATAAAAVFAAPRVLPAVPGFEVRRVEVAGAELLDPRDVLRSAGIQRGQSVWEDAERWEAALERHGVIESARVTRRLPGTLRVVVEEKRPVAYLAADVLVPVTASGEPLPVDPMYAAPDLPLVRPSEEGGEVPATVLAEAKRLARMDPHFLAEVSEIRPWSADGRVLLLRHRRADIVTPGGMSADRLVELRAVLADLDGRGGREDAGGVARLDLRFADQIVVRLPSSLQKP
jgi:cell division protein FtsQ